MVKVLPIPGGRREVLAHHTRRSQAVMQLYEKEHFTSNAIRRCLYGKVLDAEPVIKGN